MKEKDLKRITDKIVSKQFELLHKEINVEIQRIKTVMQNRGMEKSKGLDENITEMLQKKYETAGEKIIEHTLSAQSGYGYSYLRSDYSDIAKLLRHAIKAEVHDTIMKIAADNGFTDPEAKEEFKRFLQCRKSILKDFKSKTNQMLDDAAFARVISGEARTTKTARHALLIAYIALAISIISIVLSLMPN